MKHILQFRVFEAWDSPPQWRIHGLCKSIGLDYPDYDINHDLTVNIGGEDWDEGDLTKVRDAGGSWDKAKGKFVDQSGSVVDPRAKSPSSHMEMVECVSCGNDMPRVRLDKYGYKMCVKCSESISKSAKAQVINQVRGGSNGGSFYRPAMKSVRVPLTDKEEQDRLAAKIARLNYIEKKREEKQKLKSKVELISKQFAPQVQKRVQEIQAQIREHEKREVEIVDRIEEIRTMEFTGPRTLSNLRKEGSPELSRMQKIKRFIWSRKKGEVPKEILKELDNLKVELVRVRQQISWLKKKVHDARTGREIDELGNYSNPSNLMSP